MLDKIIVLLEVPLLRAMVVLPLAILINILFGVVLAEFKVDYDPEKFKVGFLKGFVVYIGIALYIVIAVAAPEVVVNLFGTEFTIIDAIYFVVWGTTIVYIGDGMYKLAKIFNFKVEEI